MKKVFLDDWEILDALVTSDEWDNRDFDLEKELEALRDIGLFKASGDHTFAHIYLDHAEDLMFKKSYFGHGMLSLIYELREAIKDPAAWRIFTQTVRLVTHTIRAGNVPTFARAEAEKKRKSITTREIKKRIMRMAIRQIFNKLPKAPKTLGTVWQRFDQVNQNTPFRDRETKKEYRVKTATDKKGRSIIIITAPGTKTMKYSKRSLQHFIDELKNDALPDLHNNVIV